MKKKKGLEKLHNRLEFSKLQVAAFISQTGSHFLTLALAAFVLATSGSAIHAALVFVLSYLPSVFVSARLGAWIDLSLSKWLLACNEAVSIVASLLCGFVLYFKLPLWVLCVVLALRSLLLFISRTAMTKWIKLISPQTMQASRIKLFFLSFFLSTALSGVLAGTVLATNTILMVVAIDVATYGLSTLIILGLTPMASAVPSTAPSAFFSTLGEIVKAPHVCAHFTAVCLSQALFQGAYSVLVSYLPIQRFQMGLGGSGIFQLAASFGIIGGFLVNWRYPRFLSENHRWHARLLSVSFIGVTSLVMSIHGGLPASIVSFFLLNFTYECIWLYHSAEFFQNSPAEWVGRYQFTLSSCASFLMALWTLAYSIAMEYLGLRDGVIVIMVFGIIVWIGISALGTERKTWPWLIGRRL